MPFARPAVRDFILPPHGNRAPVKNNRKPVRHPDQAFSAREVGQAIGHLLQGAESVEDFNIERSDPLLHCKCEPRFIRSTLPSLALAAGGRNEASSLLAGF